MLAALRSLQDEATRIRAHVDLWLAELAGQQPLPPSTERTLELVRDVLGRPSDLVHRRLRLPTGARALVLALDGLVGDQLLHHAVIDPLRRAVRPEPERQPGSQVARVRTVGDVAERLIRGYAVVCPEGAGWAWAVDVRNFEHRRPNEPELEPSIRGPREGMVEVLRVNTAAIRRRLATTRLRIEELTLGRLSATRVAILHLAGRADPEVVAEVRRRLQRAPWDTVLSPQQVESLLEDRTWSLFPQVRHTERPDVCVAALNEGRVVVLLEGNPEAIIVPTFFWDLLQSPDDYHLRWPFATALRSVRLLAVLLMLAILPAFVGIVTFHQELIPTEFFLTLVAAREGVPLPTLLEAFALNLGFDLLREASTRLPKQVGGALTIVGALVIGESAVRGGFVSAPLVILIGLAALSAFVLPAFSITIPFRVLNYVLLLLAGTLGLIGVSFALVLILGHMAALTSVGQPYLAPLAPFRAAAQRDVLVRAPYLGQAASPSVTGFVRPPAGGVAGP